MNVRVQLNFIPLSIFIFGPGFAGFRLVSIVGCDKLPNFARAFLKSLPKWWNPTYGIARDVIGREKGARTPKIYSLCPSWEQFLR
jgi:hypothetical protein